MNDMESDMLRNLLARIHRDGGHHTEAVGLAQSVKDADAAVVDLLVLGDQIAAKDQRIAELEAALAFFRSVILSGESWTAECEQAYQQAKAIAAPPPVGDGGEEG